MKVLLFYIIIIFSFIELQGQELRGYFIREANYSIEDSSYQENIISGNSITIDFFNSKIENTNIIRIGHKTKIGTIFHDYIVVAAEVAKTKEEYNIIVASDKFGGDIAFKYNNEDFLLLYNYREDIEKWTGFYAGMLLNENTISYLSLKSLSK
jgi:hypothetical protein